MDSLLVPLMVLSLISSFCSRGTYLAVSQQMGMRITNIGATETIRCLKENQGTDLVVWSHKGEDVSLNGYIYTTNEDHRLRYSLIGDDKNGHYNLQIENVQADDTGTWECKHGPMGQVENVIKSVTIVIAPDDGFPTCGISASPSSIRVGDPFQLTCTSSGGYPAPTLVWLRDGVELSQTSEADVLILDRVAEQSDYNAQYTCEILILALETSRKCTQIVMVLPTEAPTARVTTRMVSTPWTQQRVTSTKKPNKTTQKSNTHPEHRTTMAYRPTKALTPEEPKHFTRPTVTSSDDHTSNIPRVTNAKENRGQITDSVSKEATSEYMFDALAVFGLLCGVFLLILILMAVSWRKGHSKAAKCPEQKIAGSTETLTETNPNWVRPYSTVTISSATTTDTVYDIPRIPSVFRTSYIDTSSGRMVSSIVIDDPNKIYQQGESENYYSDMPLYSKVKK